MFAFQLSTLRIPIHVRPVFSSQIDAVDVILRVSKMPFG